MSAEKEDKENEISRGKTMDMMIKATYVKLYHQGTKMDWLRMVFSTTTGLKCTLSRLCKYCTGKAHDLLTAMVLIWHFQRLYAFLVAAIQTSSKSWIPVTVWNI